MSTTTTGRIHYIFVDYENVQAVDLDLIAGRPVKVFLVVGHRRKSLPSVLARQIHQYHDQVTWIASEGAGPNALDLVLAYHVGAQARSDAQGHFHILSKDKDYDALIKHLRANGIPADRVETFAGISALVEVKRLSLTERVERVIACFKKNQANRPKRKRSLLSAIHSICHKELSDREVELVVNAMAVKKLIEVTPQGGVIYRL